MAGDPTRSAWRAMRKKEHQTCPSEQRADTHTHIETCRNTLRMNNIVFVVPTFFASVHIDHRYLDQANEELAKLKAEKWGDSGRPPASSFMLFEYGSCLNSLRMLRRIGS